MAFSQVELGATDDLVPKKHQGICSHWYYIEAKISMAVVALIINSEHAELV